MAESERSKRQENKMTIYLDNRAVEEEEKEDELEQQKKEAAKMVATIVWHAAVAPVVFFLLWNSILTPLFGFAKIGYLKSLGILFMAHLLRGSKNE
jgi:hypothetical protein